MNTRDLIRQGLPFEQASIMEIGPLNRPYISKAETDVIYVDHADTETLRQKYSAGHGFDTAEIVNVDAVWGQNSLAECINGRKVDYVVASHVIEHVPDLITWLKELSSILTEQGEIRLVIPDKRFTFDYRRRPSELPEVISAHISRARRPQAWNILDHLLNVRAVDAHAAWLGPLTAEQTPNLHDFEQAIGVAQDAVTNDTYHDVHCWVFTPESFANLMAALVQEDLVDLSCHAFRDTQENTIEFVTFLRRTPDKAAALASWRGMANQAFHVDDARASASLPHCQKNDGSKLEDALRELGDATRERDELRHELEVMKGSRSWHITAPLRRAATMVRPRARG